DGAGADRFGQSVAIDGDTVVAGAPFHDVGAIVNQGSASVFVRSGGVWTQQQQLTASDGAAFADFGLSVAIDGDTIVVGAPFDAVGANVDQGSAYVFADPVPTSLALTPPNDTNVVGSTHMVTAAVTATGGQPLAGVLVRFTVTGSVSTSGSCTTNASGQCGFTYTGPALPGADAISAYAETDGDGVQDADEPSAEATKAWVLPSSTPGQVSGGGNIEDAGANKIAFGFSARNENNGLQGQCNVVEPAGDRMIKCLDVTAFAISGNEATIYGNATDNGIATTYVIRVKDVADPGRGADTFSIQTASGYGASGVLNAGNVNVG
ncbi:MAG: post-COAP-1 domain-containing protein, partial [Gaiellaceae bacterium]